MKLNALRIVEFTNPSGATVYRVDGKDKDGKRVRENFKTQGEAQNRKSTLENEIANLPTLPLVATRLTHAQVSEAELAFEALKKKGHGKSLAFAIDYFAKNFHETEKASTVKDAFDKFIAAKEAAKKRPATIRNLRNRVGVVASKFPDTLVSDILPDALHDLIYRPGRTAQTSVNDRAAFSSFFAWCVRQRFCKTNPAEATEIPEVDETRPVILPLATCRKLVNEAATFKDGKLLPYVALGLFCAIRPTELERLNWDAIDLGKNIVRIDGGMAKMRTLRDVEISENCAAMLREHSLRRTPIKGPNWRKDFDAIKGAAEIKEWTPDILRHSGISHHLQKHSHEGLTAQWAGNSPDVVQKSYKGLVSKSDSEAFWKIGTKAENIVKLEKAA